MTVSLHTVDLAKLFVDVQKSILENTSGMNCTCGENLLTEENITNATIMIVQEQAELQVKPVLYACTPVHLYSTVMIL